MGTEHFKVGLVYLFVGIYKGIGGSINFIYSEPCALALEAPTVVVPGLIIFFLILGNDRNKNISVFELIYVSCTASVSVGEPDIL